MNSDDTAAAWRVEAQLQHNSRGVRNTPPPVQVKPTSSPSPAPLVTSRINGGCVKRSGSPGWRRKRRAEASSTSATNC